MSPQRRKGKKVRVPLRRNRAEPARPKDWTRKFRQAEDEVLDAQQRESVIAKGDLSRQRTVIESEDHTAPPDPDLRRGRVTALLGLIVHVDIAGRSWPCTVRRLLRTRLIRERNPIAVGDWVWVRTDERTGEGVIEHVEPRTSRLSRRAQGREHVIAANVDQALVVSSVAEPLCKPHLIDRYLVSCHAGDITPVVCMNKIDLADRDEQRIHEQVCRRYERLGYRVLRTSALTGEGIDELRDLLREKVSVIVGQSGVGKSSLLNAVQPGLGLKIAEVSRATEKGRHTTTHARLIRLDVGGWVVDTPGIRSFELGQVPPGELEAYFIEIAPLVSRCRFPDCTHRHEVGCAVLQAVADGIIDPDRYASYAELFDELLAASSPD